MLCVGLFSSFFLPPLSSLRRRLPAACVQPTPRRGRRVVGAWGGLSGRTIQVPKPRLPPARRLLRRAQAPQRVGCAGDSGDFHCRVRVLFISDRPRRQAIPHTLPGGGTVVHVAVPVKLAQLVAGGCVCE